MRFIIPGPPSGDSFQENVAYTLRALGHEVIVPRARSTLFRRIQSRYDDFLSRTRARHIATYEHWLLRAAASFKPDVLLCTTQVVTDDTLARLRQLGVRHLVAWWGDAPGQMRQMGLLSDLWTAIFLKDPDTVEKFRRVKLNAHLLHEAMNPAWHKPVASQRYEHVVIAGSYYGYRQFLASRLIADGVPVALYGPPLPRWAIPEIRSRYSGLYIEKEGKSRVFGEASACLNSTQFMEGNSLNCRAFEIAGAAGFQICEYRPIIEQCFVPGKELVVFR